MYEELNSLLIQLCRTLSTRRLYFTDHPKVKMLCQGFIEQLKTFCKDGQIDKLFLGIINGNLVFEGRNLVGPSIVGRQLVLFADNLHCGGFSFSEKTTLKELNGFLDLAAQLDEPTESLKASRQLLIDRDIVNIEIAQHFSGPSGPLTRDQQALWQGQDSGEFFHSPTLIYQALFDTVAQAHGDVAGGKDPDIDTTRSVSEYMLHFTRSHFSDLMQHVHYPDFDSYTVGHSVRVAALAVFLAHSFGWRDEDLLAITTACLLHDIGKSRVANEILYKPGALNNEEFEAMMAHSQIGAEILLGQKAATPLDIAAAWGHHIRNDGSGYPHQPKWAARHPFTALLQICDVFEALTAVRPYKPILSPHMAYSIMLTDKGGFHPTLLASFISTVGLYPPGNIVKISDGTMGTVQSVGPSLDRPEVKITHDRENTEIPVEDQYVINMSTHEHRHLSVSEIVLS